jgi:hypothetical protein
MSHIDIEVHNDTVSKIRMVSGEKRPSSGNLDLRPVSNFTKIKKSGSKRKVERRLLGR